MKRKEIKKLVSYGFFVFLVLITPLLANAIEEPTLAIEKGERATLNCGDIDKGSRPFSMALPPEGWFWETTDGYMSCLTATGAVIRKKYHCKSRTLKDGVDPANQTASLDCE